MPPGGYETPAPIPCLPCCCKAWIHSPGRLWATPTRLGLNHSQIPSLESLLPSSTQGGRLLPACRRPKKGSLGSRASNGFSWRKKQAALAFLGWWVTGVSDRAPPTGVSRYCKSPAVPRPCSPHFQILSGLVQREVVSAPPKGIPREEKPWDTDQCCPGISLLRPWHLRLSSKVPPTELQRARETGVSCPFTSQLGHHIAGASAQGSWVQMLVLLLRHHETSGKITPPGTDWV